MKTSLLVPCYNAAGVLPRLWETVRAQSVPFDECICYDDASTDRTIEVARSLGATVISGEANCGPARARNRLWQAASGDWIHFHDADDLLVPGFLAKMQCRITAETDVVVCDVDWVDERTRAMAIPYRYSNNAMQADPVSYLLENPVGGINGLYRRSVVAAIGGFDERLRNWEDADLHVRLAGAGARFLFTEEVLCVSLRNSTSVSMDYQRNWKYRLEALLKYEQLLPVGARPALAREAERAALSLAGLGNPAAAAHAIALARRLGANPPTTRNWALRLAKRLLPALWLVQLQARMRRASQ